MCCYTLSSGGSGSSLNSNMFQQMTETVNNTKNKVSYRMEPSAHQSFGQSYVKTFSQGIISASVDLG
jgi:hypothetical protein